MRFLDRGGRVPADVLARADLPRGEKVLAHTVANDGTWLLGTRLHLVIVGGEDAPAIQIPWESVEDAAWEQEPGRLRVTEIGTVRRTAADALVHRGRIRPSCCSSSASG